MAPSRVSAGLPIAAQLRFVALFCLCFVPAYAAGLWRAEITEQPWIVAMDWERQWPFWPWMMPVYLSLFAAYAAPLFVLSEDQYPAMTRQSLVVIVASLVVFMIMPTQSGFPPSQEIPPGIRPLFALLHTVDRPYNLVPSLHVAGAAVVLLASAEATTKLTGNALRAWLALICASTLFVHQHHLVDIGAGLLLALLARRVFPLPAAAA